MKSENIKIGDKVKTIYGNIETVCLIRDCQIWTKESED
jgi:hypothetical protein